MAIEGSITALEAETIRAGGLSVHGRIGDLVAIEVADAPVLFGEIVALEETACRLLPYGPIAGCAVGDPVRLVGPQSVAPREDWIGRVLDGFGRPLSGDPAGMGGEARPLNGSPPPAADRRGIGPRVTTPYDALNTWLPICRGQRIGIFAGSGVGKSTMFATLAAGVDADVIIIGLIGERSREVREFIAETLGPEGMRRAVVIAATSDQPAVMKRRAALLTMAVAEYFRDRGRHVLCLVDSLTRLAEAHREIALAAGEMPSLHAFPPSTAAVLAAYAERAGPGRASPPPGGTVAGDITAVFTVLVAGSDMEGPVADIVRGLLDGHIVLDRVIADRGRYPAIDIVRSVSRSLPGAASEAENALLQSGRAVMSRYEALEPMLQMGLYQHGTDAEADRAIALWPALDRFVSGAQASSIADSFTRLRAILEPSAPTS